MVLYNKQYILILIMSELEALKISEVKGSAHDKDNVASHAIDGKETTKFSVKGKGEHLVVDLGSVQMVSRLSIKWFESDLRQQEYTVYSSLDGNSWKRIGAMRSSGSKNNEREDHDLERAIAARFFKIENGGNTLNNFMSIIDVQVFGEKQFWVKDQVPEGAGVPKPMPEKVEAAREVVVADEVKKPKTK
jgi:hypothetical protein